MSFFKQLADLGNIDITLRIMQKNDKLTINVMPGSGNSIMHPIIISGTPEELDAEFIEQIMPGVQEVKGLVSNLEEVKKDLAEKKETSPSKASSESKKEKGKQKSGQKSKPVPAAAEESVTPNLFPDGDE